jgi:hypothetical protein
MKMYLLSVRICAWSMFFWHDVDVAQTGGIYSLKIHTASIRAAG